MSKIEQHLKNFKVETLISAVAVNINRARGYDSNVAYNTLKEELAAEIENDKMDIVKCMKLYGRIIQANAKKTLPVLQEDYSKMPNPWR